MKLVEHLIIWNTLIMFCCYCFFLINQAEKKQSWCIGKASVSCFVHISQQSVYPLVQLIFLRGVTCLSWHIVIIPSTLPARRWCNTRRVSCMITGCQEFTRQQSNFYRSTNVSLALLLVWTLWDEKSDCHLHWPNSSHCTVQRLSKAAECLTFNGCKQTCSG